MKKHLEPAAAKPPSTSQAAAANKKTKDATKSVAQTQAFSRKQKDRLQLPKSESPSKRLEELNKKIDEMSLELNDKLVGIKSKQDANSADLDERWESFKEDIMIAASPEDIKLVVKESLGQTDRLNSLDKKIETKAEANRKKLNEALEKAKKLKEKIDNDLSQAEKEMERSEYIRFEKAVLKKQTKEVFEQRKEISQKEKQIRKQEARDAEREKQAKAAALKSHIKHLATTKAHKESELFEIRKEKEAELRSLNVYKRTSVAHPATKRAALKEVIYTSSNIPSSSTAAEEPPKKRWAPRLDERQKPLHFDVEKGVAIAVPIEGKSMASTVQVPKGK
ncbi:hypothetical protein CAEBREN_25546 [Caenorhabditis brenneri]|uniref:Uncharacterized protein n=1 Tax=Caenorhabditis brenneri TaxID=135651 RepID=G0P328_CAEBE|nr:hypothetical protein CAEBREN_25546 [Caenorhabditis brenneri]